MATVSCTSQNLGSGNFKRIKKVFVIAPIMAGAVGIIVGYLALLFSKQLLSLYLTDELAIAEGLVRMKAILPFYFICGIMDALSGVVRGASFAIYPTIVNLIGVCGLRILWIFTVFQIPEFHTISVLFLSWPISWIFVIIALLVFYFVYARKEISKICNTSTPTTIESEKIA